MPKRRPAPLDPGTLAAARAAFISAMTAHYGALVSDPPRTQHHCKQLDAALTRAAKALIALPTIPTHTSRAAVLVRNTVKHLKEYQIWRTAIDGRDRYFATRHLPGRGYARIDRAGLDACPLDDPEYLATAAALKGPHYASVSAAITAIRRPSPLKRKKPKNID